MTKLTIALTRDEMEKLRKNAKINLRNPHDQARHILRLVLLGSTNEATKDNTDVHSLEPVHAGVVGIAQ